MALFWQNHNDQYEQSNPIVWGSLPAYDWVASWADYYGTIWNPDGSMVVDRRFGNYAYRHTVPTPWSVASAAEQESYYIDLYTKILGVVLSGSKMFLGSSSVTGNRRNQIRGVTMSTPWLFSSGSLDVSYFEHGVGSGYIIGHPACSLDGKYLYIVFVQTSPSLETHFIQVEMATPGDLSTASVVHTNTTILAGLISDSRAAVAIHPDGANIFVLTAYQTVKNFGMTTPFDLSTLYYIEDLTGTGIGGLSGTVETIGIYVDGDITYLFSQFATNLYRFTLP